MKLHVLFGQRKEDYPEQFAPEALACAAEYDYDDNPDYLDGELEKRKASGEFEAVRIVTLNVNAAKLMEILRPPKQELDASIVG